MSRHQYDLVQCMKQPGTKIARVCLNCDGRCPICDSYVKPTSQVRCCADCSTIDRCIMCNSPFKDGSAVAYYCLECVVSEKDREGCPRILNVGSSKADMVFNKRK